ncbi:homoserine kinase [Salinibacterium sp. G-O1]|uniref:homoserine kinase n=1 Tax=Salinibacterium sp. G-O1 TaxID=3046208 RepID=UPI0024BAE93E|nr:homoserine kinase [Salinibacterium sp. G-O1]MDJ0334669.1 homoserine kinase [Salinibacterium sp. G-O1]
MTLGAPVAGRSVIVRVPATSANLGPGFDTLGLALAVYDELIVTATAAPGVLVDVTGVGKGEVPTDESNLVARSIAYTFERVGQPVPGLHLVANNVIPHGGGLGSSAAAIVSGVMAAAGLLEGIVDIDVERMLIIATELEGHPDNVAPALFGGLTIAWTEESGPRAKSLDVHQGVFPLVFVPDHSVSTALARSLQPATVPFDDAVFNVSRVALLIAALTQSPELLLEATEDRLHQEYRASAMPETNAVVHLLREHGFAAVVSGAGPSILVLASDSAQREAAAALVAAHSEHPWRAVMTAVDFKGATVNSHQVEAKPQP